MFILKTIIDKYCNSKDGRVFACFVDFQKAFDTVIHTGIKLKLIDIGVGNKFYNIIKNMYEISSSSVRCGDLITKAIPIKLGVKQGDNLSPNLFNIFINDLPNYFQNCKDSIQLNDDPVNCLLYADDLILISKSANGLQERLNALNRFCKDWCLTVNINKTKVLVFNKAGRFISQNFKFNNISINCVQQYKYLGIYFTASGSFAYAQNELYKKALKAYFKFQKDFLNQNPNVDVTIHLFDHTILPILLYGSEIWGSFNPFSNKLKKGNKSLSDLFSHIKSEKMHLRVCKQILGVHSKATNFAVLSELGRFPLCFNVMKKMINYWYRLQDISNDSTNIIIRNAFLTSKYLFENGKSSWFGSVHTVINAIPGLVAYTNLKRKPNLFKKHLNRLLRSAFLNMWEKERLKNEHGKLRNYIKFKQHFHREKYLRIMNNFDLRKHYSRFRISCHHLIIETGRYKNIPSNLRICTSCNSGEIGDEIHFLLCCKKYENERKCLLHEINSVCGNFQKLSLNDKMMWLMSAEDKGMLIKVARFIKAYCD